MLLVPREVMSISWPLLKFSSLACVKAFPWFTPSACSILFVSNIIKLLYDAWSCISMFSSFLSSNSRFRAYQWSLTRVGLSLWKFLMMCSLRSVLSFLLSHIYFTNWVFKASSISQLHWLDSYFLEALLFATCSLITIWLSRSTKAF